MNVLKLLRGVGPMRAGASIVYLTIFCVVIYVPVLLCRCNNRVMSMYLCSCDLFAKCLSPLYNKQSLKVFMSYITDFLWDMGDCHVQLNLYIMTTCP